MREQLAEFLPNVYRFARQLTQDTHIAEDLSQEAMVRALAAWERGMPERPLSWLLKVVENLWRDRCRESQRRPVHQAYETSDPASATSSAPGLQAEQREEAQELLDAMRELPERQRAVMHLLACELLSISEISHVLEITPEAVRSSLSVARKQLRKVLAVPHSPT